MASSNGTIMKLVMAVTGTVAAAAIIGFVTVFAGHASEEDLKAEVVARVAAVDKVDKQIEKLATAVTEHVRMDDQRATRGEVRQEMILEVLKGIKEKMK